MTGNNIHNLTRGEVEEYLLEIINIYNQNETKEHSFRYALQRLLTKALNKTNIQIIQEAKGIKSDKRTEDIETNNKKSNKDKLKVSTPDFSIKQNEMILGYIETKGIDANYWKTIRESQQIQEYLSLNDNILITNYLEFKIANNKNSNFVLTTKSIFDKNLQKMILEEALEGENLDNFNLILKEFFSKSLKAIGNAKELAKLLATRSKYLKTHLETQLKIEIKEKSGEFLGLYNDFSKFLNTEMEPKDFADTFAQVISYSLFLAKLNAPQDVFLSIENCKKYIDSSFELIKDLISSFDKLIDSDIEIYQDIKWLISDILGIINAMDSYSIVESLKFSNLKNKANEVDPYIYFYEDFLREYDKKATVDRGVFYTPPFVVKYIIKSINEILHREFDKSLSSQDITVLDFACGTGTFLLESFKEILEKLPSDSVHITGLIKEHILKNIYGFEYLMAPYVIAHLRLSQYLKEYKYNLSKDERIQVYMANTLAKPEKEDESSLPYLKRSLAKEAKAVAKIKEEQPIMVIMGNPPYNRSSQNPSKIKGKDTYIGSLMQKYIPQKEKSTQALQDDYIKFICYAQEKLKNNKEGIIGIITNNSFLNGIIHRKMRCELLNDFAKIYILNLHGNKNIKEIDPSSGKTDGEIFNIKVGTTIVFFIKKQKESNVQCEVFYSDCYGSSAEKKHYLESHGLASTKWQEITGDINNFNQAFNNTKWGNKKLESPKEQEKNNQEDLVLIQQHTKAVKNTKDSKKGNEEGVRFYENLSYFVPFSQKDINLISSYGNFWGLKEIFNEFTLSVTTGKDELFVDLKKEKLQESLDDVKYNQNLADDKIKAYAYRPFDTRFIYYDKKLFRDRYAIMQHLLVNNNCALIFARNIANNSKWQYLNIVDKIVDQHNIGSASYAAPLYLTKEEEEKKALGRGAIKETITVYGKKRVLDKSSVNFKEDFQEFIATTYNDNLSFSEILNQGGSKQSQEFITPEDVLGYVYAILNSPLYVNTYETLLKLDFPRIFFTQNKALFCKIAKHGRNLMNLHLKPMLPKMVEAKKEGKVNNKIEDFRYSSKEQRLYLNANTYFENVSQETYDFKVGDSQVLPKYLKDREKYGKVNQDYELSNQDYKEIQAIINGIKETLVIKESLDELVKELEIFKN